MQMVIRIVATCHERLSPTAVLVIAFGLFSCTVSVLVCILNSIASTFSAAYGFRFLQRLQVTPLVTLTDRERDPKYDNSSFIHSPLLIPSTSVCMSQKQFLNISP